MSMYENWYLYEILLKNNGEGGTDVGVLVDEDMGEGPFRCRLYGDDLLIAGETRKVKLLALNPEVQKLIRAGSGVNLVNLKEDKVTGIDFVPTMNGA